VKQTLENMIPCMEKGAANPIELGADLFARFLFMHKKGVLQISEGRLEDDDFLYFVSLTIPGQPTMGAKSKAGVCYVQLTKILS
jgi:hypothetical protein